MLEKVGAINADNIIKRMSNAEKMIQACKNNGVKFKLGLCTVFMMYSKG